ncbi:hypothetical protein DVJ77_03365 [Dyella tabacisoli]|uniref:Uncharacterized protein n=2 Tax=Dyella tabacisoli TaxID=2282381 RepID=A0A369USH1_9GAMM|nr:hypothetical protein DVJ77_03365 [Dyella tabacisoli]
MRTLLFAIAILFSLTGHAAGNPNKSACQADLKNLVVPNFKTAMNKSDISVDIDENDHGVYKVRLSVAADNPGKQVSIGWVTLDTNKGTAYDISKDDRHPETLHVDAGKYQNFIDTCLHPVNKSANEALANTHLPFAFETYFRCATGAEKANDCSTRFHAYPVSAVGNELRNQIDSSIDTVFFLPPLGDLKIILAGRTETDVNAYELYVFKGNKRVSKELIGNMDDDSMVTFDISKDYLITTYARKGTIQSKISKVTHLKLDGSGNFITCADANPTCK